MLRRLACASGHPMPGCNEMYDFGQALSYVNHLKDVIESLMQPYAILRYFSGAGNPIGCQIMLPTIGSHNVVMKDAWKNNVGLLTVKTADPSDASILPMHLPLNFCPCRIISRFWPRLSYFENSINFVRSNFFDKARDTKGRLFSFNNPLTSPVNEIPYFSSFSRNWTV